MFDNYSQTNSDKFLQRSLVKHKLTDEMTWTVMDLSVMLLRLTNKIFPLPPKWVRLLQDLQNIGPFDDDKKSRKRILASFLSDPILNRLLVTLGSSNRDVFLDLLLTDNEAFGLVIRFLSSRVVKALLNQQNISTDSPWMNRHRGIKLSDYLEEITFLGKQVQVLEPEYILDSPLAFMAITRRPWQMQRYIGSAISLAPLAGFSENWSKYRDQAGHVLQRLKKSERKYFPPLSKLGMLRAGSASQVSRRQFLKAVTVSSVWWGSLIFGSLMVGQFLARITENSGRYYEMGSKLERLRLFLLPPELIGESSLRESIQNNPYTLVGRLQHNDKTKPPNILGVRG